MNLFKILVAFSKADKSLFDIPVDVQKRFLESQPEPHTLSDRSYNQYKAQMLFVPGWKCAIQNIVAFLALPFAIVYLLIKSCNTKRGECIDAIGEFKGLEETVPTSLTERYTINNDVWDSGKSLTVNDLGFILRLGLFRQPFFVLKTAFKVALYSHSIRAHTPNAIIVHNEYSFTSSVLTEYCHKHGVKHINAMHGEKLFYIRDSWFQYDECYVWDKHYVNLFVDMKACPEQFLIEVPYGVKIDLDRYSNKEFYADFKYYLGIYSENEIETIVNSLKSIKDKGFSVKFRPHPFYSDIALLKRFVDETEIESPAISIMCSISNTRYVIGSYSTVLNQAYYSGRRIVLDDITYIEQYNKLKSLNYILNNKCSIRLSELQKKTDYYE